MTKSSIIGSLAPVPFKPAGRSQPACGKLPGKGRISLSARMEGTGMKKSWESIEFWIALALIAVLPAALILFNPAKGGAIIAGNRGTFHWLAVTGAAYLALSTPVFFYAKHRFTEKYQPIMKFHAFGNILALILVTFHATFQTALPFLKVMMLYLGPTLYISLILLLVTGFVMRFRFSGKYRPAFKYLHVSLVVTFYVHIFFHVMAALRIF